MLFAMQKIDFNVLEQGFSKVRIGIIINVKRSKITVITKLVFINMFIALYNNST